MKIILIGIAGSGKSTQGKLLSKNLNIPYLSSGHIFRYLARQDSIEGKLIKETIEGGNLIPDDKSLKIIEEYLAKPEYKKGYILDGFPRTRDQAEKFKETINYVFYFKISDKEALWRLSGREDERLDNTLKAIRRRIDLFHELTEPVLSFYREKGILIEIDSEKTIEEIERAMLFKLPK